MEKGRVFEAVDLDGNNIECEIIMSYICDKNNQAYVFYTDNKYDEEGNLNLFASRYLGEDNGPVLEEITDEDEWNLLDEALLEAKNGLEEV